jgi:hypothetical protein
MPAIVGHVVNCDHVKTFSAMMYIEGSCVLMVLADLYGYGIAVGDISTAYLYVITQEKFWTCSTEAFVWTNHAKEKGMIGQVKKVQYGLPGSGHAWWLKLSEALCDLGLLHKVPW